MESTNPVEQKKQKETTSKEDKFDINDLSDFDLAEIVCNKHFIKSINGEFHRFNGKCYEQLDDKLLNQLVLNTFWNEQKQIRSPRKIRAIVDALHMLNFIDDQESDEWLGFENGILDIKNWIFHEFPLQIPPPPITYFISSKYNWTAHDLVCAAGYSTTSHHDLRVKLFHLPPTPSADKFFFDIANGDPYLVQRIYEMIGYILIPDTKAKSFFLLQGSPHSGKSVLGRFVEDFFPKSCVTALDISRLSGQYLPKSLSTSRLNLSMDLPDGLLSKKAVAMLKMLTGDDLVTLESKYREAKPYRGQCKFLFSINGKLKMYGRDSAFLDRIVCIPFKKSIPPECWDTDLRTKLQNEREAIMMKALFYYRAFVANNRVFTGNNKFFPDIELRLSPNETIEEFVKERCNFIDAMSSYTEDLYGAYLAFCVENHLKPVGTKSGFAQRLAGLFPTQITPSRWREDGKNIRGFGGILLKKTCPTEDFIIRQKSFDEYDDSDDYYDDDQE